MKIFNKLYNKFKMEKIFHFKAKILLKDIFNEIHNKSSNSDKYSIIIFDHFFAQDISALEYASNKQTKISIKTINPEIFVKYISSYLPTSVRALHGYYQENLKKKQQKLKKKFVKLLINLNLDNKKICFLSPSDCFWWLREFINACKEVSIPFVVLDKEGTIAPYFFNVYALELKEFLPCICDYVLVWSHRQKEFYKLWGFETNKIKIVGQPRSDFWFSKERWPKKGNLFNQLGLKENNPTILYFDFEPNNYIHDNFFLNGFTWEKILTEIHSILFEVAREFPDINIVFKVHPQASNSTEIKNKINALKIKNVFFVPGPEFSNGLILHSNLIIGQVSTAMIDAMVSEKPIIYTFWDNVPEFSEHLISFHECDGIEIATSSDDLKNKILNHIKSQFTIIISDSMKLSRNKFVETFYDHCDGKSSERALSTLIQIMENGTI